MRFREYAAQCQRERQQRGQKPCQICEKGKCRAWWIATGRKNHIGEPLSERFFTTLAPSTAQKLKVKITGKECPADFLRRLVYKEFYGDNQQP